MLPKTQAQDIHRPTGAAVWLMGSWVLVTLSWWAFAFITPGPTTAWLKSAQAACFGTFSDGLPSTWGWAVLFMAPLSLLTALLVVYADELIGAWSTRSTAFLSRLFLAMAVGALATQGVWVGGKVTRALAARNEFAMPGQVEVLSESYPRQAKPLPHFRLFDQRGRVVDNATLKGGVHVLTFAYAHCATVCPFLVRDTLKAVRASPGSAAVFLTLDPWRDTPSALPGLAKRWGMGEESSLISGAPKEVIGLLEALGVPYKRDPLTGMVDHPPLIYVVDAQGRIAYTFNHPSVEWIEEAIKRLKRGR